ncbi:hypothetical protein FKM82_006235 [Ascaphus truei]
MSVLCKSPSGCLLDELPLLSKWYQHGGGLPTAPSHQDARSPTETLYSFREDLFLILKPHISSQPPALTSAAPSDHGKSDMQCQGTSANIHSKAVRKIHNLILEGSKPLVQEALEKGFLQPLSGEEEENRKIVPGGCSIGGRLAELCDMAKHMPLLNVNEHTVHVLDNGTWLPEETDLLSHITENNSEWPKIIHLLGEKYLIPPKSSFLLSDVTCMEPLLHYKRYNIIVIDPPWENKSVKRSKRYNYLSPLEMKQLPIPALAASDCLVITWVTNRQKHLHFVKEELYPHWSVKPLAEWHWVKITRSGEFIFPLDSAHKKPYEILVLGQVQKQDPSTSRKPEMNLPPIPEHKLIVSVPCTLHSHKPPLSEVLKEYVKPDVECLELFARSLQPGWSSWGNEVLKFQHMDYFIPRGTGN